MRAYYYCSIVGDTGRLSQVEEQLKTLPAIYPVTPQPLNLLHPVVFKKENQKDKASGVDVRFAVDALNHIYSDNMDVVSFVSGDGDFSPVAEEAVRHGKLVHVAALSSGLNPQWRRRADVFTDLDATFFDPAEFRDPQL